ncbi:uncharacterized protein B0H64DRAFT_406507 [Chaetomium fimeti]|uniref:BTB domain-containing protein n=1 Tax=Chaetomium fimeti TaxID=1854472 RepID=A0AAE0LP71_9PEZI|nr:hypothetical protein B0H64DRAFT_406507 [Chaetomium fimeti]
MASVTPSNEDSAPITVDIAPDGDVVFIVGPTQRRIRVHSLFVKTASPVLDAMLGPNFKEGQRLAETSSAETSSVKAGPVEIELPEDDADAIEIILNIIHGRNNKVPEQLSPNKLLQVALAGDKYDCLVSLAFAIWAWIGCKGINDPEELWALALSAYLFQEEEAFAEATSALIFNHEGSYIDLVRNHEAVMDHVMLFNTAAMLEEARNRLRMKLLMDVLRGDGWQYGPGPKKRKHEADCCTGLVLSVGGLGNASLSRILETLRQGDDLPATDKVATLEPVDQRVRLIRSIADKFAEDQHGHAHGLCTWCVRTGEDHDTHW